MKILLVGINAKYIHPSLALYQLKLNATENIEILEFTIKEPIDDIYQAISSNSYDLIGFSCYLWNILIVDELCSLIKKNNPHTKIILGGPEVSYQADYFLKQLPIDFIIRGEGEIPFNMLIKYLKGQVTINEVPSLSYLVGDLVMNNDLIFANLDEIKLAPKMVTNYWNRIIYLESSRGCPYNCSYCCAALEKRVRFFSVDSVLNLLSELMAEKVPTIKFLDRTFNASKKNLFKILNLIEKKNICTTFQFEIVVDKLDHETLLFLSTLKKKCLRFEIGIQSTNELVNTSVNRSQNMKLLKENIRFISSNTLIDLHLDLIAGLPYETKQSFISSFNEVILLFPKELQLGFLKFLRGTDILKIVDSHDYLYETNPPYEIIKNKYLSVEDILEIKIVELILNKFYNDNRFPKTIINCLKEVLNPYQFFLDLGLFAKHQNFDFIRYQPYDLANLFNSFLTAYFKGPNNYSFLLKQDYLSFFKTKPKIWWNNLTKDRKKELYPLIASIQKEISIDDLYRYSIVVEDNDLVYISIYKNYQNTSYLIKLH